MFPPDFICKLFPFSDVFYMHFSHCLSQFYLLLLRKQNLTSDTDVQVSVLKSAAVVPRSFIKQETSKQNNREAKTRHTKIQGLNAKFITITIQTWTGISV